MPFSYSYFSSAAILVMIFCLTAIELVKYLRRHTQH